VEVFMRRAALVLMLLSFTLLVSPVMPQPYGPVQRQPAILNGCTENALFAILNSDAGKECLRYLPRASNVSTDMSIYCRSGRWGCCDKTIGYPACKIEDAIPVRRRTPPPVAIDP
jgi:hypothetical protein